VNLKKELFYLLSNGERNFEIINVEEFEDRLMAEDVKNTKLLFSLHKLTELVLQDVDSLIEMNIVKTSDLGDHEKTLIGYKNTSDLLKRILVKRLGEDGYIEVLGEAMKMFTLANVVAEDIADEEKVIH